jgi:hypothetical protein
MTEKSEAESADTAAAKESWFSCSAMPTELHLFSIREFGLTNPVLVDGEQGIIAGHGRILAARKLGMDLIPTIELAHLTETQRQAYIIADNKLAENAGWDPEMLRLELGDLKLAGFDLFLRVVVLRGQGWRITTAFTPRLIHSSHISHKLHRHTSHLTKRRRLGRE